MSRALVLGGTGVVGRAVALRLAGGGWRVDVTGGDGVLRKIASSTPTRSEPLPLMCRSCETGVGPSAQAL